MRLQSGNVLGPYLILDHIGAGGMGEVYRGRNPRLGREVAIKILAATADSDRLSRFEREARATAVLAHPNIVTVFDVGVHDGLPFLVSELLEGETLRQRLARGPVSVDVAVDLTRHLIRAVAAAHALRIVHRDLKPENLFITRSGVLKVLDFGLAKLWSESPGLGDVETTYQSQPGVLIGTPAYMAPEQLRGVPADERADIFAIGAILTEMVCGTNPFRRETPAETIAAIIHEPPRLDEALVPDGLTQIVRRCLQKNRADRFETAADLAFAIELVARELQSPASRAPAPRSPPHATSIAVLPFADMSPTRDQDYLCEGLAEELINVLTQIEGLRVAARSSSFQFRSSSADVRAIGARLGVTAVLEGGVRRLGDQLRVTVQLVDVSDGYQRWSRRYDADVRNLFAIQDEIAESVATALRGILTARERDDVHSWSYEWMGAHAEDYEAADVASRKALELAPSLAEAHSSRGFVLSLQRHYDEAAVEFEEAIRLNPSSYDAYYLYGRSCFSAGRIERSAELFRRAGDIRPEDYQSLVLASQSLSVLGRDDEARRLTLEGIRRAERRLELDPSDIRALSLGANALFEAGERDRALAWSARSLELDPTDPSALVNGACLHASAGLKDEALDLLERALAQGWGKRDWVEHDPDYDSLRGDPRFEALVARLS